MGSPEQNSPGTYAFFLDAEIHETTAPVFKFFYEFLLADEAGKLESFRLRTGSLLQHSAYRPTGFQTSVKDRVLGTGYDGGQISYQVNAAFWVALMADIADSARETWYTFDPLVVPYYLATRRIWILATSGMSHGTAERIDVFLRSSVEGYLGALKIDAGNPVQVELLWTEQVEAFIFDIGHLGLCSNGDEEEFPLAGSGEWWSGLDFKSVFWLRRYYGTSAIVEEELVLTEQYDSSRPLPPDLVPGAISPRGAASQMLFRNGTRLTVVEKVATAVFDKISNGQEGMPVVTVAVPRAAQAFAQPLRVQKYLLNPEHPKGKEKARLFAAALGLTADDWRYLSDQLTQGLASGEVMRARVNADGTMQFDVNILVLGKNGRTVPVLSAWLIRESVGPELITAYPAPKGVYVSDPDSFPGPRIIPDFDPSKKDRYGQMYEIAHSSGLDAASMVVPTPILIGKEVVNVISEGDFGTASVNVRDARRGFARWLISEGKARTRYRRPGAWMSSPSEYSHVARAEAYARAFAEVLRVNGIDTDVEIYLK